MSAFTNTNNYLIIGSAGNRYYIHERECNKDGTPGKIQVMADGKGNVKEVAKNFIDKGFNADKIIINGQLASDVFEKSKD